MVKQNNRQLSRRQARDLDVEIGFLEALVRRDPDYVEALQVLGDGYSDRGRPTDGLRVDERLLQLRPDDALVRFNYACSLALNGPAASIVSPASTRPPGSETWPV